MTFLVFEISALLFSGQVGNLLAGGYITTLLCGAAFGNMIRVEYKTDVPPSITQTSSEGKDITHSEKQQPKIGTTIPDKSEWNLITK